MPSAQPLRLENSAHQVLHRFPLDSRTEPTFYFYGDSSLSHSSSMTQHHWLIFLFPICCFLTGHTCAVSGCRKELTNGQCLGVMDICGKPTFTEVDHIRVQSKRLRWELCRRRKWMLDVDLRGRHQIYGRVGKLRLGREAKMSMDWGVCCFWSESNIVLTLSVSLSKREDR